MIFKRFFLIAITLLSMFLFSSCNSTKEDEEKKKEGQAAENKEQKIPDKKETSKKTDPKKEKKTEEKLTGDPLLDDAISSKPYVADKNKDDKLGLSQKLLKQSENNQVKFYEKFLDKENEKDEPVEVTISFDATNVTDIVPAFSQILKFNYIVDPQVKGVVTMSVNAKMTKREIWQMFEQILWLSGAYCSVEGDVVQILPFTKMPQERKILADHDPHGNVQVELVPVRHIASKDMLEKIKPFLTEGATAIDIPHQNSILLVETPINIPKLKSLFKVLDVKDKSDWPQTVIRCNNVSCTRVKNELASLMPIIGFPVTVDTGIAEPGSIHLTSIERLQAIIASAATQEAIDELVKWAGILDRSDVGEQERVYVYKVMNSKADELTQALSTIFSVDGTSITPSNSSSSSSTSSSSTPSTSKAKTDASPQKSPSTSTATIKSSQNRQQEGPVSVFDVPVKVFADSVQNRLVIKTVPRTYAMVNAVLTRLDTVPSQVLLQVTISEITLTNNTQYGLEFSNRQTSDSQNLSSLFGTNYKELNPGGADQYGFKYHLTNTTDPNERFAYLKTVAGKGKINVLSSPQIVVVSHSEAKIDVGDKVPILTSEITDTASSTQNNTSVRRSIQYENTGIILTVTPHVTKGGIITLDLKQEVSDAYKNTLTDLDSPVIQQRIIKTSMLIKDGSTLFVGGLIREKEAEQLESVPFLIDIPLISKLTGDVSMEKTKTELVVMITGKVIDETSKLEEMIKRYNNAVDMIRRSEIENERDIKKRQEKEKEMREKKQKEESTSTAIINKIKSIDNIGEKDSPVVVIKDEEPAEDPVTVPDSEKK